MFVRWLMPIRFKKMYKEFSKQAFSLLDVGCGNCGPHQTQLYFPQCDYHGIDCYPVKMPSNLKAHLYQLDLEKDDLLSISDESFDVLIASHVLEHLEDPVQVLKMLCKKVKPGGRIYLEFPSIRSLGLPSMLGTLQFCDDPSHVHLPNPYELINTLLAEHFIIRDASERRDWSRVVFSPIFLLRNLARKIIGKRAHSKGLWDLKRFAFFIDGEKKSFAKP